MELTLNLTQHETTAEQSYAGVRSMHSMHTTPYDQSLINIALKRLTMGNPDDIVDTH
jgi:hypothetical protein